MKTRAVLQHHGTTRHGTQQPLAERYGRPCTGTCGAVVHFHAHQLHASKLTTEVFPIRAVRAAALARADGIANAGPSKLPALRPRTRLWRVHEYWWVELRLLHVSVQRRHGGALERVRTVALPLFRAVLLASTLASTLAACSTSSETAEETPPALRDAIRARTIYPAKREEWRADITEHTDSTMVPVVLRASRSTVALLQSSPARISQFELHGQGMLLSTRPARVDAVLNAQVPRDIVAPTDLSRVTSDGEVDVIDSATSTLVRESIGGFVFRRDLPMLRGGSGRLCTVSPATLLHVRHLGARRALEAFTLTADPKEDMLQGRHRFVGDTSSRLRFGGGDSRHCLLLTEREVLIVSAAPEDSSRIPTVATPRITRLRAPGEAAPRMIDDTVARDVAGPTTNGRTQQPFVVDASIVDGGFVVLLGLTSDRQGRIIDYYDEVGKYIQSAMLPFTATSMSGAGPRFLALHQDAKYHWWLSSWLTPMAARGATAPPPPPKVQRAPERALFEPSSK